MPRTVSSPPQPAAAAAVPESGRPVHEVRHGRIRAAVWRNPTEKGPMYSVSVSRSYKDAEGAWHDSHSFGFEDVLTVAKAMYDAHSFISAQVSRERAEARTSRTAEAGPDRREA
jgi:hypothetical protein